MRSKQEDERRRLMLWLCCWVFAAAILCSQTPVRLEEPRVSTQVNLAPAFAHGSIVASVTARAAATPTAK